MILTVADIFDDLVCASGWHFLRQLRECIPEHIFHTNAFSRAVRQERRCQGGLISTLPDLEALRYCDHIQGSLTITVDDVAADFTALHNIISIQGLLSLFASLIFTYHSQAH
jgi:hypothetical protein